MEKHLINTTEDLQRFVRINISVLEKSFLPYEALARKKHLIPYIGQELHDELLTLYYDQIYPQWAETEELKRTLDKILAGAQSCLANFTLYMATPHMDIHLSSMGFVVQHNDSTTPASAQRVQAAQDSFLSLGYDSMELLLELLEASAQKIPSYKNIEAHVLAHEHFINSAKDFDRILSIGKSRLRFISLKKEMTNIEKLSVEPIISSNLAHSIKEQLRQGTLTPENKRIAEIIKRACAYLAVANTLTLENVLDYIQPHQRHSRSTTDALTAVLNNTRERMLAYGKAYLGAVRKILKDHPQDYPLYMDSPVYDPDPKMSSFENNEDNRFFVFGQPPL